MQLNCISHIVALVTELASKHIILLILLLVFELFRFSISRVSEVGLAGVGGGVAAPWWKVSGQSKAFTLAAGGHLPGVAEKLTSCSWKVFLHHIRALEDIISVAASVRSPDYSAEGECQSAIGMYLTASPCRHFFPVNREKAGLRLSALGRKY